MPEMTADDFRAFLDHMGWNRIDAAEHLGLSRNSVTKYLSEGAPLTVALACAARSFGLPPWRRS